MARIKGTADIAPQIRGAFIRAVKAMEDGGKPLSTIIMEQLEKNPLATLQVMSKFMPREHKIEGKVEHEHQHTVQGVSETLQFLESITTGASESSHEEPGEVRPLLPH